MVFRNCLSYVPTVLVINISGLDRWRFKHYGLFSYARVLRLKARPIEDIEI
jgi:hypothetical protein